MSNIDFEIKGIGKFIKENNLKVPIYQRPFAWGDKQVEELINDIKESINEDEYFLGTIVLTKIEGESKLEIVDGQQRISSIIIFFSALRKHLIDSKKSTSKIQSDYLSEYNTFRPHSALGYLPPTPETVEAIQTVSATLQLPV